MKKRRYGKLWALGLGLAFSAGAAMISLAAEKAISSVSIRIDSELNAGTTLPDINTEGSGDVADGEIRVTTSSDRYYISDAVWKTSESRIMNVGDTPEMQVTLTPSNENLYGFQGTYRSSNVSVRSGSYVSASKKDGNLVVKLKVKAIEGVFAPPEDAYWKDNTKGTARWEEPEEGGTGRYEVVLRRGSSKVHSAETTSHSYNFYPYMTKKGTYTFRVRTIAKTNKQEDYGESSEWVESEELYLPEEDVSDGSGQNDGGPMGGSGGNTRVGWQKIGGSWYYYYPDGSYQKDGWAKVNGQWYLFQGDGQMLTGWQNRNNQTYYLHESGAMAVGWIPWNNRWYYLNPTQDSYEGCMLKDRWADINGKTYYFTSSGAMAEGWNAIGGNYYYFYPGSGHKAVNTMIDTFYVNEQGVWVQ